MRDVLVEGDDDGFFLRSRDQLAGRLVGDHPAVMDDRDPVAQLLGFLEVMRGQDDRDALAVQLADVVPQLPAELDIDPRGRLVEHQDRRRMDHRLGDQQPPLHAARQRARIGIGLVGQMHRGEQLVALPLGGGMPYSPAWISSVSRGVKKGSKMISCGTTPIERLALRGCSSMSKPQMFDLAAGLHDQPREDVDQRRLARTVGTEQPENLPARNVEADLVQRLLAARIGLRQRIRCGWRRRSFGRGGIRAALRCDKPTLG